MVLANRRVIPVIGLILLIVFVFAACSKEPQEKKSGQALVSVGGKEITMLQLNDEIRRANIRPDQYEMASKQLLESLIARQLIVDEAMRSKLDRTPDVMQARERANAQVIAQAYMQNIMNKVAKPSKAEIDDYFHKHPEFFSQRKQFDLTTVRIATRDLTDELKSIIDAAKSLDEVIIWLDKNKIQYFRNLITRSTADLPSQLSALFQEKSKDTIFIVNEQENSLLIFVNAIKNNPIPVSVAAPQIERLLLNQKYKEATEAEIARLRAAAKIEYLSAKAPMPSTEKTVTQSPIIAPEDDMNSLNPVNSISEGSIERGITGLK